MGDRLSAPPLSLDLTVDTVYVFVCGTGSFGVGRAGVNMVTGRYKHLFNRQLGCLAFSLRFWSNIKQFLSNCPASDWTFSFKTADFLLNRVKINYFIGINFRGDKLSRSLRTKIYFCEYKLSRSPEILMKFSYF